MKKERHEVRSGRTKDGKETECMPFSELVPIKYTQSDPKHALETEMYIVQ